MKPIDELRKGCSTCAEHDSESCSDCNPHAWFEMACCCMGCGLRRDPLPERAEMWVCQECSAAHEGVPCFCCGAPLGRMGMCDVCDDPERDGP